MRVGVRVGETETEEQSQAVAALHLELGKGPRADRQTASSAPAPLVEGPHRRVAVLPQLCTQY